MQRQKSPRRFSPHRDRHGWPVYLTKTRHLYKYRIAYCIGLFRQALIRGSEEAGVPFDMILPSRDMIDRVIEEGDCVFEEGSLSMDEYLGEFCDNLITFRNSQADRDGIAGGADRDNRCILTNSRFLSLLSDGQHPWVRKPDPACRPAGLGSRTPASSRNPYPPPRPTKNCR